MRVIFCYISASYSYYISGNANGEILNKVKFGINGGQGAGAGWTVKNAMVVNYMSAHDNNTLWDKLLLSNPENTEEERVAMNKLGAAILMISRGMPFFQAGEEMLRTKDGDENSYKSSDEINNIDWEVLTKDSKEYEVMQYYKQLMELRNAYEIFQSTSGTVSISFKNLTSGAMVVTFTDNTSSKKVVAVINPSTEVINYELTGEWYLIANENKVDLSKNNKVTGNVTIDSIGISIYANY